ncbi:unnamed protein product [Orchesella dallaii]|uniref:EIPR1-like beta-propeller domain-containing protein n=1 Tax=Orchesella dallaii TaxID=48710 RepID=A0ABP1RNR3_9HEXA
MESCAIYGLETQGRALCSQAGEEEIIRFFVGTLSPRAEGQIHQLDFSDETNQITRKIFKLKVGEVWQVQCSPWASNLLGLCYNEIRETSAKMKCGVWKVPNSDTSEIPHQQQELVLQWKFDDLHDPRFNENCQYIDWHPSKTGRVATIYSTQYFVWDVEGGEPKLISSSKSTSEMYMGKWNPHLDGNQLATVTTTAVSGVDMRSMKQSWSIPLAHKFQVRDVDFNPNKQYCMATCGDDCAIRFWDVRNHKEPLKDIKAHSHWVWRVRYNGFHDQLLLTAGSDSRVLLHCLPTISSEPKGHSILSDGEEEVNSPPLEEGILAKYEEHEDAVYAVEWSTGDPWIFASLSYDGRVVINRVPKSFKYKILL